MHFAKDSPNWCYAGHNLTAFPHDVVFAKFACELQIVLQTLQISSLIIIVEDALDPAPYIISTCPGNVNCSPASHLELGSGVIPPTFSETATPKKLMPQ